MPQNLNINFENVKKDDSNYRWVNIEWGDARVGRASVKKVYRKIIKFTVKLLLKTLTSSPNSKDTASPDRRLSYSKKQRERLSLRM